MNVRHSLVVMPAVAAAVFAATSSDADAAHAPELLLSPNASGLHATVSVAGPIDLTNPFFQPLGTNGRSCDTCHQPSDGWSVTPSHLQARFEATAGHDPIFRPNDGSNSPLADVSTVDARRSAYSMLLTKGLIRVGIGIPEGAEFELAAANDPYGYASARELSLFRRPLPSTNLKFLSTVMWDGRETFIDPGSTDCVVGTTSCFASMHSDLSDQANAATLGHAQSGQGLTDAQREAIVDFELGLFTAQIFDSDAKYLGAAGAKGGPQHLAEQEAYFGINDVVSGDYRTQDHFNPAVFDLYDTWMDADVGHAQRSTMHARQAVARGQALFNSKPIRIAGVKGLNDDLDVPVMAGTCSTCHDTPGAGNHSIPTPLDIGIADASRSGSDMPVYTLRNKVTGELLTTTDPGRALITGRWKDIGRFKGPVLRGLAARPPYFHNGFAADLFAVVDFYNERFGIGLTSREREDLVAFLRTL